jgi:hypothetical protein
MSMSKITRDLQWLTDDDGHLVGYRLNDGQEVTIGTSRPANAAAVVGAAVTRINVGGSADTFIVEV